MICTTNNCEFTAWYRTLEDSNNPKPIQYLCSDCYEKAMLTNEDVELQIEPIEYDE